MTVPSRSPANPKTSSFSKGSPRSRGTAPTAPGTKRFTVPAYRQRKGYDQAIVTLTDSASGKRRDYWLGPYGSTESRELYHRLIAEWEAKGRRFPDRTDDIQPPRHVVAGSSPTVAELIQTYWRWAKTYYQPNEVGTLKVVLRLLRRYHGSSPAVEFGPSKLRRLRDVMIHGDPNPPASPTDSGTHSERGPRRSWSRGYINHQTRRIRAMFKWASSHEMIPIAVHQALATVEPLKRGRTAAREGKKVGPVPMELVDACRPYLSRQTNALIDLQLLTGARCGELVIMRPVDIEMNDSGPALAGAGPVPMGKTWAYRPSRHKTEYLGKERVIYLGPKAQEVLRPFLAERRLDQHLFSPQEAEAERRAKLGAQRTSPLSSGNRAGTNRSEAPKRVVGAHYTSSSYYVAIRRPCDQAWEPPVHLRRREVEPGKLETIKELTKRLTAKERAELTEFHKSHRWHPHQLRHNAATKLRKEFGLEAAQLVLGHSSATITDAVYAERDASKITEVIRRVG